jgi:hypothetical protein
MRNWTAWKPLQRVVGRPMHHRSTLEGFLASIEGTRGRRAILPSWANIFEKLLPAAAGPARARRTQALCCGWQSKSLLNSARAMQVVGQRGTCAPGMTQMRHMRHLQKVTPSKGGLPLKHTKSAQACTCPIRPAAQPRRRCSGCTPPPRHLPERTVSASSVPAPWLEEGVGGLELGRAAGVGALGGGRTPVCGGRSAALRHHLGHAALQGARGSLLLLGLRGFFSEGRAERYFEACASSFCQLLIRLCL